MLQSASRRGLQVGQQSSFLYTDNPVQGAVYFSRPSRPSVGPDEVGVQLSRLVPTFISGGDIAQ